MSPDATYYREQSDFQLIAGTNRDLFAAVRLEKFREDLLARINLWTFSLPGLRNRGEDIEPNLIFELDRFAQKSSRRVTFSKEARDKFLSFALSGSDVGRQLSRFKCSRCSYGNARAGRTDFLSGYMARSVFRSLNARQG
jgi:sigma54-dependent transcription regulator